jgi:two-component sensor histidine kinase
MTGYTRAEVEEGTLSWRDMTPPEWVETFQEHLRRLDETGRIGPYEMEYLLNDGSRAWMLFAGRDLGDGTVVEYVIDITGRKHAEEERELLTHELSHRVKNTLAVVQAIAMQTDGAGTVDEYRDKFVGRLQALGRAHGLLLESQWRGTRLDRLVRRALEPYTAETPQSVELDGEALPVSTGVCIALSLVLHELATNALKYGALSVPEGRLGISWAVEPVDGERWVRLIWRERGGPPVEPPTGHGFGTKLIQRAFAHELGGEVELDYAPEGLTCTITFQAE